MDIDKMPKLRAESFDCPHCSAFAQQIWGNVIKPICTGSGYNIEYCISVCAVCGNTAFWEDDKMVFPLIGAGTPPNSDMPDNIKNDYNEASNIVAISPRSACVLLRICIEKICDKKNAKGNDLNKKIKYLVKQGLDKRIQQSLDTVRIKGNIAAHPSTMYSDDNIDIAHRLFGLVNVISNWAHTQEKEIKELFDTIPETAKIDIKNRDK